jgi:ankyrin repeat protein
MRRILLFVPLCAFFAGCGGVGFVGSNADMRTPLEKAAQDGDLSAVQRLLASGADANERGKFGDCPLSYAALHEHNGQVIHALIAAGADPNGPAADVNRGWGSPLALAAESGELENTRVLLDSGAAVPKSRCSALVVGWLKPDVIDLLARRGLDIFVTDASGRNALHLALAPPVVPGAGGIDYLLRAGVPINARDHTGKTPLACWHEPRDFEVHWLRTWLFDRLGGGTEFQRQRENRVKISALLERAGATL